MLRTVVLLLVLLNGAYFAWGQGWLLDHGVASVVQHEPQRLAQQVRPEAIEVISLADASKAPTPQPTSATCLASGLLDEANAQGLRDALTPLLPEKTWTLEYTESAERWIIYMGKYANAAELAKKRAQLQALRLPAEVLRQPALTPGLSLGVFASQTQAEEGLKKLASQGVRTARVLQETPSKRRVQLRLNLPEESLKPVWPALNAALPGLTLSACPTEPAR